MEEDGAVDFDPTLDTETVDFEHVVALRPTLQGKI